LALVAQYQIFLSPQSSALSPVMRLLIVIVNYRTASLAIDCLRSIAQQAAALRDFGVVVTDNSSGDDSIPRLVTAIEQNGWSWAQVMPLEKNGGFAFGNNAAIKSALAGGDPPQYVLLLNPDTLARPNALAALLDFMDEHPQVGIAGSRLEHLDGTAQISAFRFHSVLSELESGLRVGLVSRLLARRIVAPPVPLEPCQTDWVAGAAMIIRKAVFDAIGLMDERYFMYFEDVDFCLRARRAGWPCWYVPASRVVHLVGQSSGVTDVKQAHKRRPRYWFESRRLYFTKNLGRARAMLADMAWAGGFAVYRLRAAIMRKRDAYPPHLLWDFVRYNFLGARNKPDAARPPAT
jgi:N-acetylglucosaminyl-diphospho-decaprenol L-rhamnosyltransferase